MTLADTGKAIGAVTKLLQAHLLVHPGVTVSTVTVGKPEPPPNMTNSRLNLFLYEIQLDPNLRNKSLDRGQPAPLWLVLKYLMTAFDTSGDSDTTEAHEFLGEGMRALQELSFLPLSGSATILSALKDNPEVLKITFDGASVDLLSKLMQGSDEKYRCSFGFEVRPVMIATSEPPSYSLLVGIDYLANQVIGEQGIQIPVMPFGGPTLHAIAPSKFVPGDSIILKGSNLNLANLSVRLGKVELPITAQSVDALQCLVNAAISGGEAISAGSYPISVVQNLPKGRQRSSNLLVGNLLPVLTSAVPNNLTPVPADTSKIYGNIDLTGELLGTEEDDVFVALYQDGRVIQMFDELVPIPPPPPPPPVTPQTRRRVLIKEQNPIPPGKYRVILRVNGQQAKNSPEIDLVVP